MGGTARSVQRSTAQRHNHRVQLRRSVSDRHGDAGGHCSRWSTRSCSGLKGRLWLLGDMARVGNEGSY
jgi:hypothetical protein